MRTKHNVILALFVAIAAVLHIVESWIPIPIPVPGAKLGLANIVAVMVIYRYTVKDAFYVTVLRVLLGSLLGGVFIGPSFAMSFCGAITSTAAMAYSYKKWHKKLSIVGISVIGAATHNIGQIIMASIIVVNVGMIWYLPYLLLLAVPTGIATGCSAYYFLKKLAVVLSKEKC